MKVVLFLAALSMCIAPLYAISCYSCAYVTGVSPSNDPCLDASFDATMINNQTCSGTCEKSFVTTNGAYTTLTRGCSTSCNADCTSFFSIRTCTHCCSSADLCNSATSVGFSVVSMVTMLCGALWMSA